jgi:tripartite-type tricarboxylate transporter receptor subunit TctC
LGGRLADQGGKSGGALRAGSATDLVPRTVFDAVATNVKQTIIIENRPAGGTTVGTSSVAKSDPDGYTILVHSNAIVTVPAIQANVPYDPVKDFAGVTPLANVPLVLVSSPEKKVKTMQELVAMAKAKPGAINYAAAGIGTPPHLAMERLRLAANFKANSFRSRVRQKDRPKYWPVELTFIYARSRRRYRWSRRASSWPWLLAPRTRIGLA